MNKEKLFSFSKQPKILGSEAGFNKQLLERAFTLDVGDSIGLYYRDLTTTPKRKNEDIMRVEKDLWHAEKSGEHYITGSENLQFVIETSNNPNEDLNPKFIRIGRTPHKKI